MSAASAGRSSPGGTEGRSASSWKYDVWKLVLDKGLLAALLATLAFWFGARLEAHKADLSRELDHARQELGARLVDARDLRTEKRARIAAALKDFYWPLYYRIERDNNIWEFIWKKKLRGPDQALGAKMESAIIVKNHHEMVALIEKHSYLAHEDPALFDQLRLYTRHADVYLSLREVGDMRDPVALSTPEANVGWPAGLFEAVKARTFALQRAYDELGAEGEHGPPAVEASRQDKL